jgi:hypothetical protein
MCSLVKNSESQRSRKRCALSGREDKKMGDAVCGLHHPNGSTSYETTMHYIVIVSMMYPGSSGKIFAVLLIKLKKMIKFYI